MIAMLMSMRVRRVLWLWDSREIWVYAPQSLWLMRKNTCYLTRDTFKS